MTNQPAVTAIKGSVLIVLWTSVLLTVLVTAMAKARFAQTVAHNQDFSRHWAAPGYRHQADGALPEMMAPPIDQEVELTEEGEAETRAADLTVSL